jgi:alanine dehydrogenase
LEDDPYLRAGLNVYEGNLTHGAVAEAQGLTFLAPDAALGMG